MRSSNWLQMTSAHLRQPPRRLKRRRQELAPRADSMEYTRFDIERLYLSGEYLRNNPTLHAEDSGWKAGIITPFLDRYVREHRAPQLKVLDVGGGAGLLLQMIGDHLTRACGRSVLKC